MAALPSFKANVAAGAPLKSRRAMLDTLVRRHQSWVFNLAQRMVWRREVARFLGTFVAEHRLSASSAAEIARHLAYDAAKLAYRLD